MNKQQVDRLREALGQQARAYNGYPGLAKLVFKDKTQVDTLRKKLAVLVKSGKVSTPFTVEEWMGINKLLAPYGGLGGVLQPTRLIDKLVEQQKIMFLVGSAGFSTSVLLLDGEYLERNRGDYVHASDLDTVTGLIRAIDRTAALVNVDIVRSMIQKEVEPHLQSAWYKKLNESTSAVCSVGNPATCPASEVVAARVLGFEPWTDTATPPFRFAWPRELCEGVFSRPVTEVFNPVEPNQRAFEFNGRVLRVQRNEGRSHGVLICGWLGARPAICIAGTTAPLTTACAKILAANSIPADFPPMGEALIVHIEADVVQHPELEQESDSPESDSGVQEVIPSPGMEAPRPGVDADLRAAVDPRVTEILSWNVERRQVTSTRKISQDDSGLGEFNSSEEAAS